MTHPARAVSLFLSALVLLAAPAGPGRARAASPEKLRLPADIVLDQQIGSDGAVLFRHSTHAAFTGMQCGTCHPAPFRMLRPERTFTHEKMNAGQLCGACHDGRGAFSTADDAVCGRCHPGLGAPEAPWPPEVAAPSSGGSPGAVVFRHATHAPPGLACADCHPRPFMKGAAAGTPAAPSHETCGACHQSGRSFAVDEDTSCERCHTPTGGAK